LELDAKRGSDVHEGARCGRRLVSRWPGTLWLSQHAGRENRGRQTEGESHGLDILPLMESRATEKGAVAAWLRGEYPELSFPFCFGYGGMQE